MKHVFKVKHWNRGKAIESEQLPTLASAIGLANQVKARRITVLRADTDGINAGKFFLHQIIK